MKFLPQKGFAHLALILIVLGIIVGVYLTLHTQIFKPRAGIDQTRIEIFGPTVSNGQTTSRNVKLRLIYVPKSASTQKSTSLADKLVSKVYAASCNPNGGIDPNTWTLIEKYTCDPNNPGTAGEEWACFGNDGKPAAIKFSNDVSDPVRCPVKTPAPTPAPACLPGCCGGTNNLCGTCPNGQACRISNGACQSGLSCDPNSGTPAPSNGGIDYGFQVDIRDINRIPSNSQSSSLKESWVRFVFPCTNSPANGDSCPSDYHSNNLFNSLASNVKKLAIVAGDSTWNAPIGSQDLNTWKNYTDKIYVPTIKKIINDYGSKLDALEIWNEEDINNGPSYDPYIPPAAFSYMVSQSASAIKVASSSIKVITGGLGSGDPTYIHNVYLASNRTFDNVDAIGIHPYQPPPTINNITTVMNSLRNKLNQDRIIKDIWVTEIGIQEYNNTTSPKNQTEFLDNAFSQFQKLSPKPVMVNWYAFSDFMAGVGGGDNWGLVDRAGNIKPVGQEFSKYAPIAPKAQATVQTAAFPTSFRVANSLGGLSSAQEQVFDQNNKEIDWTLTAGNGTKTVYGQFKVNGIWGDPVSTSIILNERSP